MFSGELGRCAQGQTMKNLPENKKVKNLIKGSKEINYWDVALEASVAAIPFLGPSAAALLRASRDSLKASESNDLDVLTQEADRQRVELLMAEMQAKVAQEMAIAQRIQTASEVEIEEYYEGSKEATAGISASDKTVTVV